MRNPGRKWAGAVIGLILVIALGALFQSGVSTAVTPKADRHLLTHLKPHMSENEVVALLGKPDSVATGRSIVDDPSPTKVLDYTFRDGSRWLVILNRHDQLAAAVGTCDQALP